MGSFRRHGRPLLLSLRSMSDSPGHVLCARSLSLCCGTIPVIATLDLANPRSFPDLRFERGKAQCAERALRRGQRQRQRDLLHLCRDRAPGRESLFLQRRPDRHKRGRAAKQHQNDTILTSVLGSGGEVGGKNQNGVCVCDHRPHALQT